MDFSEIKTTKIYINNIPYVIHNYMLQYMHIFDVLNESVVFIDGEIKITIEGCIPEDVNIVFNMLYVRSSKIYDLNFNGKYNVYPLRKILNLLTIMMYLSIDINDIKYMMRPKIHDKYSVIEELIDIDEYNDQTKLFCDIFNMDSYIVNFLSDLNKVNKIIYSKLPKSHKVKLLKRNINYDLKSNDKYMFKFNDLLDNYIDDDELTNGIFELIKRIL